MCVLVGSLHDRNGKRGGGGTKQFRVLLRRGPLLVCVLCAKKKEPKPPFSSFRLLSFSPLSRFYFFNTGGLWGVAALSHTIQLCAYIYVMKVMYVRREENRERKKERKEGKERRRGEERERKKTGFSLCVVMVK